MGESKFVMYRPQVDQASVDALLAATTPDSGAVRADLDNLDKLLAKSTRAPDGSVVPPSTQVRSEAVDALVGSGEGFRVGRARVGQLASLALAQGAERAVVAAQLDGARS